MDLRIGAKMKPSHAKDEKILEFLDQLILCTYDKKCERNCFF